MNSAKWSMDEHSYPAAGEAVSDKPGSQGRNAVSSHRRSTKAFRLTTCSLMRFLHCFRASRVWLPSSPEPRRMRLSLRLVVVLLVVLVVAGLRPASAQNPALYRAATDHLIDAALKD